MVTRANLDDRLETTLAWRAGHETLDDERWESHKEVHSVVEQSLRDYKRDANEWRASLADLRLTFIPKAEFQSEHRALDAKVTGELATMESRINGKLAAMEQLVTALDVRVDNNTSDIKTNATEQTARRGIFSDTRSVMTTAAILVGAILSLLLILDRLKA